MCFAPNRFQRYKKPNMVRERLSSSRIVLVLVLVLVIEP